MASKYLIIAWQPMLCPTKKVRSSGSPAKSARKETHSPIFGSPELGICGAITSNPFFFSSSLSQLNQPSSGFPSHWWIINTRFFIINLFILNSVVLDFIFFIFLIFLFIFIIFFKFPAPSAGLRTVRNKSHHMISLFSYSRELEMEFIRFKQKFYSPVADR